MAHAPHGATCCAAAIENSTHQGVHWSADVTIMTLRVAFQLEPRFRLKSISRHQDRHPVSLTPAYSRT